MDRGDRQNDSSSCHMETVARLFDPWTFTKDICHPDKIQIQVLKALMVHRATERDSGC